MSGVRSRRLSPQRTLTHPISIGDHVSRQVQLPHRREQSDTTCNRP